MSKEVNLTIAERVAAVKLFDDFKGNISTLSSIIDDVKGFVVQPEEWEAAKRIKKANTDGTENWQWTDEGSEKAISMAQESVDYLAGKIKAKSDAGEFTIADTAMISLSTKLQ